jgi:hypothetical protein
MGAGAVEKQGALTHVLDHGGEDSLEVSLEDTVKLVGLARRQAQGAVAVLRGFGWGVKGGG